MDRALTLPVSALAAFFPKARARSDTTLIIRPGGLGDLICADMALTAIGHDARQVDWLIERRSEPWAEYRGLRYHCYDRGPGKTLGRIYSGHKWVINTEQRFGLSQAYGLLARSRDGRLLSFDTNRGAAWADRTIGYNWKDAHEVAEFARLFSTAFLGAEARPKELTRPRLQPASESPLVLIAGRQQESRRLSLETWAMFVTSWSADRAFQIAATAEDAVFADELARQFPKRATRFDGDFPALCERIARSEEFLSVDGGGVHIASYFGVPTRAIFTSGRDEKWAPLAQGSRVLRRHDLACQPCTKFGQVPPCPHRYACREVTGTTLPVVGAGR